MTSDGRGSLTDKGKEYIDPTTFGVLESTVSSKYCPIMSRADKMMLCQKGQCQLWHICKEPEPEVPDDKVCPCCQDVIVEDQLVETVGTFTSL